MAGGRPTKYRKRFCNELIAHAKKGLTIEETCSEFEISMDTYYKWKKRFKEFADADRLALNHRVAYYSKIGRLMMFGKNQVKEKTWQFFMMNIAGWGTRNTEEVHDIGVEEKNRKELEAELMEVAKRVTNKD